jgi:hypothetical protein
MLAPVSMFVISSTGPRNERRRKSAALGVLASTVLHKLLSTELEVLVTRWLC